MYLTVIVALAYIIFINYFLIITKKFEHNINNINHKKINSGKLLQTGGFYFLPIIIFFLFEEKNNIETNIYYLVCLLVIFFVIGFLSDIRYDFSPKLRLLFHFLLISFFIYVTNFFILKTNIPIIDGLLNNGFFKYFFTIFCIMVFINGLNFIDGININSQGYVMQISIAIILVLIKTGNTDVYFFELLNKFIFIIAISLIFNFFFNNILGDSGVYVLGIFLSFIVIDFTNNVDEISPLLAVLLLWYPAYENLFSIIRKKIKKIDPMLPDTYHFHSLLYKLINKLKINKSEKFKHNLSGIIMNIFLFPTILVAINYFNNSKILGLCTIINIFLYTILYFILLKTAKIK